MPNPTIIHPQSTKTRHFLAIAELYLELEKPAIYEVEPQINDEYRPDVYAIIDNRPVIIEVQRTLISNKKMEEKVALFADSYHNKDHDARTLWIVSNKPYDVKTPAGFDIIHRKMKAAL